MEQFQSFYGPKTFLPALTDVEVARAEKTIHQDVMAVIKSVRSGQQLAQFNSSTKMKECLARWLDFMEDCHTGRVKKEE